MGHQRPVVLAAQKQAIARRNEEQPAVGQPIDAQRERRSVEHDLAVAVEINGNHILRAPVGEPQPVRMPAWLLAEHQPAHQRSKFRHHNSFPSLQT